MVKTIRRIGDPIQSEEYLRRAASALDVYEPDIRRQFDGQAPPPARPRSLQREAPPPQDLEHPVPEGPVPEVKPEEALLFRLMLTQKTPMVEHVLTRMGVEEFTPGPARTVVQALIDQFEGGEIDPDPFTRGEHGEGVRALVTEALVQRHSLSDNWTSKVGVTLPNRDGEPFATATSAMQLLKLDRVQEAIETAMREMQARDRSEESVTELQAQVNGLNDLRRQIERGEFMEWTP